MKELSIEEKAKAYDKVVESAKTEKEKSRNLGLLEFIDENFPELKESEDERIREELLEHCRKQAEMYNTLQTAKEYSEVQSWISWLEKQSKASKVEEAMRDVEEKSKAFTEAHKGETSEEILAQMRGEKPAEWSEEDEDIRKGLIKFFQSLLGSLATEERHRENRRWLKWLKSLKYRYTWKPSEEQMSVLKEQCVCKKSTVAGAVLCELFHDLEKLREE